MPADPPAGLRLRPAVADPEEDPLAANSLRAPLLARARSAPARVPAPPRSAPPNRRSRDRPRTPTSARSPTGKPPATRRARACHRGTHLSGPRRTKPRGRPQAPDVCTSLRQSPAPTPSLPQEQHHAKPLDFHPSGGAHTRPGEAVDFPVSRCASCSRSRRRLLRMGRADAERSRADLRVADRQDHADLGHNRKVYLRCRPPDNGEILR